VQTLLGADLEDGLQISAPARLMVRPVTREH
jgi:hypothetical protein